VPEILEIELYRRLADRVVGRRIESVDAPDAWYLKGGATEAIVVDAVAGARIVGTRRIGKLLLLDLDDGRPVLGLRFGMTGRLVVDGVAAIDELQYGSSRDEPSWTRFRLAFADGVLEMRDPRRLGAVQLDPDEGALGIDAWQIDETALGALLAGSAAPLKARLMDQARLAGLGNLLTDEILYRSGLDPARPAAGLGRAERRRLAATVVPTLDELLDRGGSHTGDLQVARVRGGRCPKDGTPLLRRTIGGRTTYSCPRHQR
jgi:formamidopyrimidine-DNA glycosylase